MINNFTVQGKTGVPVGFCKARFVGAEPVEANVEKGYKPGVRFVFEVVGGEHAGAKPSRVCSGTTPTMGNALGRMLSSLTGVALADGVIYSLEPCLGREYQIQVMQGQGGGTRVETVMPIA